MNIELTQDEINYLIPLLKWDMEVVWDSDNAAEMAKQILSKLEY